MAVTPLHGRVVVKDIKPEDRSKGGIVLPSTMARMNGVVRGTVQAVGPGRWTNKMERCPISVAVGDKVIYGQHSGAEIEEGVRVIEEHEILAVDN